MRRRRWLGMAIASLALGGLGVAIVGFGEVSVVRSAAGVLTTASSLTLPLRPMAPATRATSPEACPRRLEIEVGELRIAAGERVAVHVFVGQPEATAPAPLDDPAYVGSFSFFPVGGGEGRQTFALALDRLPSSERERLCSGDPPPITLMLAPVVQDATADQSQIEVRGATLE